MKSTNNKKKNSEKDHTLVNFNIVLPSGFQSPSIFDFDTYTCNGVSIQELDDRLIREVPKGYFCKCYICNPPRFLTEKEYINHDLLVHNIKR